MYGYLQTHDALTMKQQVQKRQISSSKAGQSCNDPDSGSFNKFKELIDMGAFQKVHLVWLMMLLQQFLTEKLLCNLGIWLAGDIQNSKCCRL